MSNKRQKIKNNCWNCQLLITTKKYLRCTACKEYMCFKCYNYKNGDTVCKTCICKQIKCTSCNNYRVKQLVIKCSNIKCTNICCHDCCELSKYYPCVSSNELCLTCCKKKHVCSNCNESACQSKNKLLHINSKKRKINNLCVQNGFEIFDSGYRNSYLCKKCDNDIFNLPKCLINIIKKYLKADKYKNSDQLCYD